MKKVIVSSMFVLCTLAFSEVMAGSSTTDNITPDPINNGKDQQENVKKSSANNYNFTLFNFFGTNTTSKSDSTSTTPSELKDLNEVTIPKS